MQNTPRKKRKGLYLIEIDDDCNSRKDDTSKNEVDGEENYIFDFPEVSFSRIQARNDKA